MFRTIRDKSGTAWRDLRDRGTLRLFAFEFVVVVLGVMTAQAMADWSQERALEAQADTERERLEQGLVSAFEGARVWRAALPCMRERVKTIMRGATTQTFQTEFVKRPKFPAYAYPTAAPETWTRIARRIGAVKREALEDIQYRVAAIEDASLEVRGQWDLFSLLDPEYGQTTSGDRVAARVAGAKILTEFRIIEYTLDSIEAQKGIIVAKPAQPFDRKLDILPVRSCEEMWAKGTAYRKIDPEEPSPY